MRQEFVPQETYAIDEFVPVPELAQAIERYCAGAINGNESSEFELNRQYHTYRLILADSSKELMEIFLQNLKNNQVIVWRIRPQKHSGYDTTTNTMREKWRMRYALVDIEELGFKKND